MIICGFPGIGKSWMCKNRPGWIDLESTPFNKDWELYTDVANHMHKQGYNVMIACHKDLREKLLEKGIDFFVVVPSIRLKDEYIKRYKKRGNDEKFIELLETNYEKWITEINTDYRLHIYRIDDKNKYISDMWR